MINEDRIYAWDARNGQVVYRIPGLQHGDGQIDSDESPVWLLGDEKDVENIDDLPDVYID